MKMEITTTAVKAKLKELHAVKAREPSNLHPRILSGILSSRSGRQRREEEPSTQSVVGSSGWTGTAN